MIKWEIEFRGRSRWDKVGCIRDKVQVWYKVRCLWNAQLDIRI